MRNMHKLLVGVCAAAGLAMAVAADAEAACGRVSAKGEGLTKELAREMAKLNLDFAVAGKGAKAAGKVSYKCGGPGMLLLTSCTAKQRACS